MKSNADFQAKYYDNTSHVGYTRLVRSKFVVLPHVAVARSCPVLKYNTTRPPASDKAELRKWRLWQHLLKHSFVLHCFPPDSMPCGMSVKHGEKGCASLPPSPPPSLPPSPPLPPCGHRTRCYYCRGQLTPTSL